MDTFHNDAIMAGVTTEALKTSARAGDLEQAGQQFLHDVLALFSGEQV